MSERPGLHAQLPAAARHSDNAWAAVDHIDDAWANADHCDDARANAVPARCPLGAPRSRWRSEEPGRPTSPNGRSLFTDRGNVAGEVV